MKAYKPDPKSVKVRQDQVREAHFQYSKKRISRREFLRFASALGAGAMAVGLLPPMERLQVAAAKPLRLQDEAPKRGGKIFNSLGIDTTRFDDPAKLSLVFPSNYVRQVCDYLVTLDTNLNLQPSLATEWMPSADGKTWTLKLREGVKFNHGKDFNADDVVFTINRLINKDTASGWAGAANYVTGAEKVDDHTVNIHTDRVAADFIYTLFLYHAAILPADWPGDFFTNPWGTGPFTIEEFSPTQYIRFKARSDYWQKGADGKPLPYLDSLEFVSFPDQSARFSALQEGTLDMAPAQITLRDQYQALENFDFQTVQTANLHIFIMKFNEKPWDNPDVVEAMKLMIGKQAYIDTLYLGYAIPADDHPIAPGMYPLAPADQKPRQQDIEKAKALLEKAGYPNGLDITLGYIDPASDGGFADDFAQFLVSQGEPAGVRFTLAPDPHFWDTWLNDWGDMHAGVSNWAQKNTASEMLNLAYYSKGVWNESHWNNPEFDKLLKEFDSTLDQEARRGQLAQLCQMISEGCSVAIPGFRQDAAAIAKKVHYKLHPQAYVWMGDAWVSG
jgi:peptide/nickel transport system substrate-binding protein